MIKLHTVHGQTFAINGDLVERVEEFADTHVTLVGGTSYVVTETLDEIVTLVRHDRAIIRALADRYLIEGDLPELPGSEPHVLDHGVAPTPTGLRAFRPNAAESGGDDS